MPSTVSNTRTIGEYQSDRDRCLHRIWESSAAPLPCVRRRGLRSRPHALARPGAEEGDRREPPQSLPLIPGLGGRES